MKRRLLSFFLCLALLISVSVYRPQRAEAVGLTASAIIVSGVIAVMAACGVVIKTSDGTALTDYIAEKLEDYFQTLVSYPASLLEWLDLTTVNDIFRVIATGTLQISRSTSNKILDFIEWFNTTEDVQSDGPTVGIVNERGRPVPYYDSNQNLNGPQIPILETYTATSNSGKEGVNVNTTGVNVNAFYVGSVGNVQICYYGEKNGPAFDVSYYKFRRDGGVANIARTTATSTYLGYHYALLPSDKLTNAERYNLSIPIYSTYKVGLAAIDSENVEIIPTEVVEVPEELESGFVLTVSTNATIPEGSTVEEAAQAILDVASLSGLEATSEVESEPVVTPTDSILGLLSDILDAIISIPITIVTGVQNALSNLFIPREAFISDYVATLYSNFDNHFSILSYPFSILGEFLTRVATAGSSDPIFTWPNIYEPFSNKLLIAAGQYNLNDAKSNVTFANVYSIYMVVIKGFLSFQFLSFLYAWFCDVFKMRNSDFDDPSAADWEEE